MNKGLCVALYLVKNQYSSPAFKSSVVYIYILMTVYTRGVIISSEVRFIYILNIGKEPKVCTK